MKVRLILPFVIIITIVAFVVEPYLIENRLGGENRIRSQCYEYEGKGYLKPGSCDCAEKVYPSWEVSYNWMDACIVLRSMERNK